MKRKTGNRAKSSATVAADVHHSSTTKPTIEAKHWSDYTTLVVAVAALVVSVASTYVAYLQKRSMDNQLDVMQNQLNEMKVEQRPWISADLTPTQLIIDGTKLAHIINRLDKVTTDDGGRINFKLVLTNVGHTPAFNVSVWLDGFVFGGTGRNLDADQKDLCGRIRDVAIAQNDTRNVLLPGQALEWKQMGISPYAGWSKSDAQQYGFELLGHHRIMMFAYGCIDYMFGSPLEHHQTGFTYMLDSDSFADGHHTNSIPTDVPLDGQSLHAYPYIVSSSRTD